MFDKRKRWFINIVLAIAVISFAGIAIALPFTTFFQEQQSNASQDTPAPSANSPSTADLEAQARGYELVLEREPDNETALIGLLQSRILLQDLEGAIAPLETLAELRPERTEYTVLLGQARQQMGDRDGAAQAYRSVLSTHPGNMNALQGLVSLMLQQARPEAAIGLLQDTLQNADELNNLQPGSVDIPAVQLLLGQVYVEQGRDDEAIAIYDEAIGTNPDDYRPILSKALVLQAQGRDDEAEPLFTSAAALAPTNYRDEINRLAAGAPADADADALPEAADSEAESGLGLEFDDVEGEQATDGEGAVEGEEAATPEPADGAE
ncbi:MAG: tetratricopeptide repeat protein [Synechococcales bacterium]|nr:tetratricopeptide repeat protein [Synechococcales bacterium]